jgi:hypothetical protein
MKAQSLIMMCQAYSKDLTCFLYSVNEPDEERILRQLALAGVQTQILISGEAADENSPIESAKIKSNVLFLYRNHRLLKPGGEMLIVPDDNNDPAVLHNKACDKFHQWSRGEILAEFPAPDSLIQKHLEHSAVQVLVN